MGGFPSTAPPGRLWLSGQEGPRRQSLAAPCNENWGGSISGDHGWVLSDTDSEVAGFGDDAEPGHEDPNIKDVPDKALPIAEPLPASTWAEYNAKQKATAKAFFESDFQAKMLIALISFDVTASLMRKVFQVVSVDWHKAQVAEGLSRSHQLNRLDPRLREQLEAQVQEASHSLLTQTRPWEALPADAKTWANANLAFAMTSISACSLEQLLLRHFRSYPYRVFDLLGPSHIAQATAQSYVAEKDCLLDAWSKGFRQKFPTKEDLLSSDCLAILHLCGHAVHWEITRIECKHSSVRRWSKATPQTHQTEFARTSARFVQQQFSRIAFLNSQLDGDAVQGHQASSQNVDELHDHEQASAQSCRHRPAAKASKRRRGGGGAQRRGLGYFLKGTSWKTPAERKQRFREAVEADVGFPQILSGSV